MARTTITAANLADYLRQRVASLRSLDLQAILRDVDVLVRRRVQESFDRGIDPIGYPWAVRKRPAAHPILVKTGALMKSATRPIEPSDNRLTRRVQVRSRKGFDYPEAHQRGTRRMPARPFLGIGNELRDQIIKMVRRRIMDMLRNDGAINPGMF